MDFWDSISKTVSEAADYTAREAGRLTGIAKMKYRISISKARLETLFASLGRLKYDELKGTTPSGTASYDEIVEKIDDLKAAIYRYEEEIAKLKNERLCVSCRAVIGIDMAFCPRCGAKQPKPEIKEDECCDCKSDHCDDDCCDDDCCDDDCCDDNDCCDDHCCCSDDSCCDSDKAEEDCCCESEDETKDEDGSCCCGCADENKE